MSNHYIDNNIKINLPFGTYMHVYFSFIYIIHEKINENRTNS